MTKRYHVSFGIQGTDTREFRHVVAESEDIALAVAKKHGFIDPIATEEIYASQCTHDCGYDEMARRAKAGGFNDRAKVIDKIKKLLALSASPNEAEALAASMKAQEWLAQYNIDMAEIEASGRLDESDAAIMQDSTATNPTNGWTWRRSIHVACAKFSFCGYFVMQYYRYGVKGGWGPDKQLHCDRHVYVGRQANVASAKALADYLIKTCERLVEESIIEIPPKERSTYRNAFLVSAATRINIRLFYKVRAMQEGGTVMATGKNLPALLSLYEKREQENKDFVEQNHGKVKPVRKFQTSSARGLRDGDEAAKRIGLDQQVAGRDGNQKRIG